MGKFNVPMIRLPCSITQRSVLAEKPQVGWQEQTPLALSEPFLLAQNSERLPFGQVQNNSKNTKASTRLMQRQESSKHNQVYKKHIKWNNDTQAKNNLAMTIDIPW